MPYPPGYYAKMANLRKKWKEQEMSDKVRDHIIPQWRLTWHNTEDKKDYNLTGSKKDIEAVLDAVVFFEGNKDIKVEKT